MSFPRALRPVFALTAAFILTSTKPVISGDSHVFRVELLHVNCPLHVKEGGGAEANSLGSAAWPAKSIIAPRIQCSSRILKGPVYDVSGLMESFGLIMPPGSRALFSPGAELLFFESTKADCRLMQEAISPWPVDDYHYILSMDAAIESKIGNKTTTLLDMKSVPFMSGQRIELAVSGDASVRLALEPVIGPDGKIFDLGIEPEIKAGGKSLAKKLMRTLHLFKADKSILGKLGDATISLRIQTRDDVDYVGPTFLATPAARAAAIDEIRKALKLAGGARGAPVATKSVPEFEGDLLDVDLPIHVRTDSHADSHAEKDESGPVKAADAPQIRCESRYLQSPVYDVSAMLRLRGLLLPEGSRALYSPEAKLLYIYSSSDDVEGAKVLLRREPSLTGFTVDVEAIMSSAGHEKRVLALKSVPLSHDKPTPIEETVGDQTIRLALLPGIWRFETLREVTLDTDAKIDANGKSVSLLATSVMPQDRSEEIKLGPLGDATCKLRMQVHEHINYSGKDSLATPEKKAEVIQEIEKALKAAK